MPLDCAAAVLPTMGAGVARRAAVMLSAARSRRGTAGNAIAVVVLPTTRLRCCGTADDAIAMLRYCRRRDCDVAGGSRRCCDSIAPAPFCPPESAMCPGGSFIRVASRPAEALLRCLSAPKVRCAQVNRAFGAEKEDRVPFGHMDMSQMCDPPGHIALSGQKERGRGRFCSVWRREIAIRPGASCIWGGRDRSAAFSWLMGWCGPRPSLWVTISRLKEPVQRMRNHGHC